jgi:hypothetical protein
VSPVDGQGVWGAFTAFSDATSTTVDGVTSPSNAATTLTLTRFGSATPAFTSGNANTASGAAVPALTPGRYHTTWTATDSNGDTHVTHGTLVIEPAVSGPQGQPGQQGPQGKQGPQGSSAPTPHVSCKLTGKRHRRIKCKVTFPRGARDLSERCGSGSLAIMSWRRWDALD